MKYIQPTLFLWLLFLATGCGNAKAVKRYNYPITKDNLEKAVLKVIESNPNVIKDTSQAKVIVKKKPGDPKDTSTVIINISDFHSPDSASVAAYFKGILKIKIKIGEIQNDYEFFFLGDKEYWKNSKSSAILIQRAADKNGNNVNQGKNENGEFDSKLATDLTSVFEKEIINKIDKELNLKHTTD